jgi:hypothetical protein
LLLQATVLANMFFWAGLIASRCNHDACAVYASASLCMLYGLAYIPTFATDNHIMALADCWAPDHRWCPGYGLVTVPDFDVRSLLCVV